MYGTVNIEKFHIASYLLAALVEILDLVLVVHVVDDKVTFELISAVTVR